MNFLISASTDTGLVKKNNEDSLLVKRIRTNQGNMVLAVVCDGMGGLAKGEVASASVIRAFNEWLYNNLPSLCNYPIEDKTLFEEWREIVIHQNEKIMNYGKQRGVNLGTTVVAMLITEEKYFVMNVGDSRAYEISDSLCLLTHDQTVVANEVQAGRMTEEEAENDPRSHVLLQCVGASNTVEPEFVCGSVRQDAVYMLCSDGFRHTLSPEEIFENLGAAQMTAPEIMKTHEVALIRLAMDRQEKDNISVVSVRTY